MQAVIPNQKLVAHLAKNLFISPEVLNQSLWQGVQVQVATDFNIVISRNFNASPLHVLDEFYRNFLGQFHNIAIDLANYRIRLFNQISEFEIDGVELVISDHSAKLFKLSTVHGTNKSVLIQSYNY